LLGWLRTGGFSNSTPGSFSQIIHTKSTGIDLISALVADIIKDGDSIMLDTG
jgi:hypothetical protein